MKRLVLAGEHVSHTAAADPRGESIAAGQQRARSRHIDQRAITLDHLFSVLSRASNALTPVERQLAGEPSGPWWPLPSGWRNEVSYEVSPLDHMPNQSMINLRSRPVPPISR